MNDSQSLRLIFETNSDLCVISFFAPNFFFNVNLHSSRGERLFMNMTISKGDTQSATHILCQYLSLRPPKGGTEIG